MAPTYVSAEFCKGERYLRTACSGSSILAIDVHLARDLVAGGVLSEETLHETVDSAIERVEHGGAVGPRVRSELKTCLGRIARGECPHYTEN